MMGGGVVAAPGKVGAKDIVSRDAARERGLLYYYQSLEAWKKIRWALGKRRPKALVTYCRRGCGLCVVAERGPSSIGIRCVALGTG